MKVAILGLAFAFIFHRLSNNQNIRDFKSLVSAISPASVWLVLISLFLLMFLNWFLESLKWKYLMKNIEVISVGRAVESVFCGLTWAVFTPNRLGEYGGRVFFLSKRKRIFGLIAMTVGAISQMVVTNIFGALALLWFVSIFMGLNVLINFALTFLVAIFCSFFLLFYFNIQWIDAILSKIKFMKRFKRFFVIFARYKYASLRRIMMYSLLRFLVFTSQYYLIINLLIPEVQAFHIVMLTMILFFIQSALPSLDLLDIGVRASTATYLFGFVTTQEVAIMAATACIWLVNLIIPAILGSVFVLKINFFDNPHS